MAKRALDATDDTSAISGHDLLRRERGSAPLDLRRRDDPLTSGLPVARSRKKRRAPPSERPVGSLQAAELAQFDAWIARIAFEEPPVAGAGAAKVSPDAELRMFRGRRVSYPPVFPLPSSTLGPRPRPVASMTGLPSRKRKTAQLVDDVMRESVSLPVLKSPTKAAAKDKQLRRQLLLAECNGNPTVVLDSDEGGARSNQLSGRESATAGATAGNSIEPLVIPNSVFFENNSFVGRRCVDLSDWACLCSDGEIVDQIAKKLTGHCELLNLRGLCGIEKPDALSQLFAHCSKLRSLDLSNWVNPSKPGLIAIANQCPLVDTLSLAGIEMLTDDMLSGALSSFTSLKNLDVSQCHRLTDSIIARLAKASLKLQRLRLDQCYALSDHAIQLFVKSHGASLRVLSLRGLARVTTTAIEELFVLRPKKLEELNVSNCSLLTDTSFEFLTAIPSNFGNRIAPGYHKMVRIDISDCVRLTSLSCCYIAASCPFLVSVRAARCVQLCDKALRAFSSLSNLEELDLAGCSKLTDEAMAEFLIRDGLRHKDRDTELIKPVRNLQLSDCYNFGEATLGALVEASSSRNTSDSTLTVLDISRISDVPASVLVKFVKAYPNLRELHCRRQSGLNRAVLARLATYNKTLEVLDIRECPCVDDLALFPLAVMQSLVDLRLSGVSSGGGSVSTTGLASLPSSVRHLSVTGLGDDQFIDDACRALFDRGHLSRLETLNMTFCTGISIASVDCILSACRNLRSVNIDGCDKIKTAQLARALRDDSARFPTLPAQSTAVSHQPRSQRYGVDVIEDSPLHFRGLAAVDLEASKRARHREQDLIHEVGRQRAASCIQFRFRSRARAVWKAQQKQEQEWRLYCASVDIQRVVRGFICRRRYKNIREQATRAVIYLQYLWRQKLQMRRIRKATSYWTNQVVLKTFLVWKHLYTVLQQDREQARAELGASKALNFWGEKTLARIFAAWRCHVKEKTIKAKKAIGFWKCQSLPRVLETWAEWTRCQQRHRQLLVDVFLNVAALETHNSSRQLANTEKANNKAKRAIFLRWMEFKAEQKRFLLKASISILSGSLLHWSFRQWYQNIKKLKLVRDKHRRLLGKIVHRELYGTWLSWREFVHEQKAKKRAFLKFSNSMQAKCWLRWKMHHGQVQHFKHVSSRVGARLMQRQRARAVSTWYEFTQEEIDQRQRKRRALAFFTNASLIHTFTAWADFAAYVAAFRKRWKTRHANANVHFALSQWIAFVRIRKHHRRRATQLQAFWRGHLTRRKVEDHYLYLIWATVLIQTAWRSRLARAIMRMVGRKARLREYLRAEIERDAMDAEDALTQKYNRELELVITLQRMWRGVAARSLFVELRRARFVLKKQQEAELQEIVRAQARQRQLERIRQDKKRQLAAIEMQRHIRGFIAREHFRDKRELLIQQRCAARVQAVYRGRMSRRRTAALRRSFLTRMEVLARRAVEGRILRTLGAKTRSTQNPLRTFLSFFGLDPATFLTDFREVLKEVREDFSTLKQFFDVVRSRVQANIKADATSQAAAGRSAAPSSPSRFKSLLMGRPSLPVLKKSDMARKFLHDFEQIVATTATEKQLADEFVQPGDAVRIVLCGHPRCGETAFVLGIKEEIAQVKLDVDGELEFFPLSLPATKADAAKRVLQKVPDLTFEATCIGRSKKIHPQWRAELQAYAKRIEDEAKRFNAVRVIQCAARVYLARMRVQNELELQGVNAARRQQALLRILQTFRLANTRIGNILVQLHFVRPMHLPPHGLSDEPLEIQKILNRFQRFVTRRKEIHQALLKLIPEQFHGQGEFYGEIMPIPPVRVVDKLIHYPLRWMTRVTRIPMARLLERRGMFELARFLGGADFVKTFEEQNVDAREHFFDQLRGCGFCPSEGWALVHGVFQKRELSTDHSYTRENRLKKLGMKTTKKVPHGWGVAHFLTGAAGDKKQQCNWLERNSIEAQFKSLELVKAMKQQERQERLTTQILARQGTLNTLRSMEGARGYAKRHAELSLLEENMQVFYTRYQVEIALREREEALLFEEEKRVNELIEKEKAELRAQGRHLHELQQQVPDAVTDVEMISSTKTALEFLRVGGQFEVEYDDGIWYACEILSLDVYGTMVAEVLYIEDQRREKIKLVEASVLEEHKHFQAQTSKKLKTVAAISAAAAARVTAAEIPFRRWQAGKAIEIRWEEPVGNGAAITQYTLEWRDDANDDFKGKSVITSDVQPSGASERPAPPTTTTLWPISERCEKTLRVRVGAENGKGPGLAGVYVPVPVEALTDVSYRTAVPLIRPQVDTSQLEKRENDSMGTEDEASRDVRRELTCTYCHENYPSRDEVHEHVARDHAVPLICPFKSCKQVCASERALRYHIWRCSIPRPSVEEKQSPLFMEIFNISRQYCMRKDRRHVGRVKQLDPGNHDSERNAAVAAEMFLEEKFEAARAEWVAKAREIHERILIASARDRKRADSNRYVAPDPLYGVDFVDVELDVARREAVLSTIQELQEDLDAFRLETNTQLDKLRHEEKELQDYIALKIKRMKTTEEEWQKQSLNREKKKAQKTLDQVQASLQTLIATSTQRIDEMTAEINRLTVIEKAFVPFIHQVIRLNRLGTLIQSTHNESQSILTNHKVILDNFREGLGQLMLRAILQVADLDAWDTMIEARRRQLQALQDELRRLQVLHLAEVESFRQKRDDGDERFQLTKLRQQQADVFKRRDLAEQALLATTKKQRRGDIARTKAAILEAEATDLVTDIVTPMPSLQIANHDMQMHERFIKGKSADAEYLKDESPDGEKVGGARALLQVIASSDQTEPDLTPPTTVGGEATGEQMINEELGGDQEDPVAGAVAVFAKKKGRRTLQELPHSYHRLECEFFDGQIRGHVRIEFNERSIYEGPWVEDVSYDKRVDAEPFKTKFTRDHWGKFTFHDGTVWQGQDVDNFFSPFTATGSNFQVTTPEGHEYIGDVRAGKFHGFGTLTLNYTFSHGEYVGEWCEGKRQGYGIERFDSGELYEGYWELDLYHGNGEMVYDDGSRYEGFFKHGKWHGEGVRTLASGDKIVGVFEDGYLNSTGILEFADKRHYTGEFRNTRRHGIGSLVFANGDRYEGPFENNEIHGEGKMTTKAAIGEPLVRLGKWVNGERVAWLSKPSTQLATATFIEFFAVTRNANGVVEMDLLPPKFKTPYAVMVAGMLPNLPDGVDASDPFVQSIVRMLAKAQNLVIGAEILEKSIAEHSQVTQAVNALRDEYEDMRNGVDVVERDMRAQARKVRELADELDEKTAKEQEMQVKVENFWKFEDKQQLERKYKQAVEGLNQCDVMDWYKLRTSKLDDVSMSLLEAFAILLNFTTNYYLNGKMYRPTKDDLTMLLSSNEENVHMGDKEGLIHRYNVKALYVLPLFDVYSFGEGIRNQMLHSITHVIHHPRLRPNNVRLYQISPAFAAICTWVRAAFFYAKKAIEICPVVKRTLEQLVVLEHLRTTLETARGVLKTMQDQADEVRARLEAKKAAVTDSEKKQAALAKTIQDIAALDAAEYTPMEKAKIKKLDAYRPPSARILPKDANEDDDYEEEDLDEAAKQAKSAQAAAAAAAIAQVNRRQVFKEDHGDPEVDGERVKKEQVLSRILENPELASEFELLKKEIHKVIDRCGGKVVMDEFPARFEEIMLKPVDPMLFGIKKLRTILLLMHEVCTIVEPEREGEVETVQFPIEPDDEPMAPRQRYFCRLCPGISYETPKELAYHERTKWHYWNLAAKREGRAPTKYKLAATFWSEAYDSTDNSICYFNKMTGEVVKSDEPPLELQANELVMELLVDQVAAPVSSGGDEGGQVDGAGEVQADTTAEDPWEEVADDAGNVYFYNRLTAESSWTRPDTDTASKSAATQFVNGSEETASSALWR